MSVHELTDPLLETSARGNQAEAAPATAAPLFTKLEIERFREEDQAAGKAVAKILTSLFLYTLCIMLFVTWWTFRTVGW